MFSAADVEPRPICEQSTLQMAIPSWLVSSAVHLLALILVALVPAKSPRLPPLQIAGGEDSRKEVTSGEFKLSDFPDKVNQRMGVDSEGDDVFHWLAVQQLPDGGWPKTSGGATSDLKTSALVTLALLQVGQTHRSGRYKDEMEAAGYYLYAQPVKRSGQPNVGQTLRTLAFCQFYERTHDPALKEPAERGIKQICASQDMTTGGWDSGGDGQADIELATWNVLALKEAHLSYLPVPPANVTAAAKWFGQQATLHTQQGSEKVEPGILLGRCYFGLRSHPWCENQLERLTAEEPSSRTLPTDYFAMRAVCEYGTRTKADDD